MRDPSDIVYSVADRQPCKAFVDGQWHTAVLRAWRPIEGKWWGEVSYQADADVAYVRLVPVDAVQEHGGHTPP